MPNDMIRYDLLVQEALCGVVSKVLADVARHGLPGDHHFYITFRTHAPGVRLSSRMRELYPEEMTIILQHQFEDLRVTEHGFEVGLSFKGVPELLLIPFDAMTGFFDPSVQFSLKFEPQGEAEDGAVDASATQPAKPTSLPAPVTSLPLPARPTPAARPSEVKASEMKPSAGAKGSVKPPAAKLVPPPADEGEAGEEAKVVSIDAFRKKP